MSSPHIACPSCLQARRLRIFNERITRRLQATPRRCYFLDDLAPPHNFRFHECGMLRRVAQVYALLKHALLNPAHRSSGSRLMRFTMSRGVAEGR